MSEQRLDRLDRAVERLMQAQREALENCERVLDYDDEVLDDTHPLIEVPGQLEDTGELYRAALEAVQAILVGASEDVEVILEGSNGGGN